MNGSGASFGITLPVRDSLYHFIVKPHLSTPQPMLQSSLWAVWRGSSYSVVGETRQSWKRRGSDGMLPAPTVF